MGPQFSRSPLPRWRYPRIENLAFQYVTDPDAAQALLPERYRTATPPIVTILFSDNNGLEFMAGGGYRLAAILIAARFQGQKDHPEGDFIVVMFENQTLPIIGGREDLGVPKIFADISPVRRLPNGHWRCQASLWGHLLIGVDLPPLRAQPAIVRAIAARRINARPWLAYKYIPSLDGPPDADYATVTCNDTKIEKLWRGKSASLSLGTASAEDIGQVRHLLDALGTLTVVKPVDAVRFEGSSVLRYDLSHRLR
jgi:acetoacetate decarboxylase